MATLDFQGGRARLSGDLRCSSIAAISRELLTQAGREGDMTVDLQAVGNCDSAAVAMLAACQSVKQRQQDRLLLENVPSGLATLFSVYGLESLLPGNV